jgi:NAD(P)-dependent dehydrogenase (short-subunit alcohol dehydrogenase family)
MAADDNAGERQQVVVVTGGGAGIGAAIAEAVGRTGAYVVTVDPGVTLDGTGRAEAPAETTADRICAAGGAARASDTSVTDAVAVDALFKGLVDEFGGLDAVINVAGISRPTGFSEGEEAAWASVLSVHLDGYLNVLRSALPIMTAAGRGRILGVTSGSGWRPANAGAYSCAKRAVAALTWQLGKVTPAGVTVNALSPIAATRMVTSALRQQASPATAGGDPNRTGGISLALAAMPSPEQLGPVGAYLGSEAFSWSSGNIIFSNGSEVAPIVPPRLLEATRITDVASLAHTLDVAIPAAFVPAEAAQETNGAGNGRFASVFDESEPPGGASAGVQSCFVVTDDPRWESAVRDALALRGVKVVGSGGAPANDFVGAAEQLERAARDAGQVDAVVVARTGSRSGGAGEAWQQVLDEHAGITDAIRSDVAWVRAVSDHARENGRPIRIATVVDATTSGGRSRAQAAAQLSRAAHLVADVQVDAFAIGVETGAETRYPSVAELVGYLIGVEDARALSGAELVATTEWIGLRSHPRPEASISFGGPELSPWVDGTLRDVVTGSANEKWSGA